MYSTSMMSTPPAANPRSARARSERVSGSASVDLHGGHGGGGSIVSLKTVSGMCLGFGFGGVLTFGGDAETAAQARGVELAGQ